jgi:hypothetical protein
MGHVVATSKAELCRTAPRSIGPPIRGDLFFGAFVRVSASVALMMFDLHVDHRAADTVRVAPDN